MTDLARKEAASTGAEILPRKTITNIMDARLYYQVHRLAEMLDVSRLADILADVERTVTVTSPDVVESALKKFADRSIAYQRYLSTLEPEHSNGNTYDSSGGQTKQPYHSCSPGEDAPCSTQK